jgi:hypothetical protein
MANRPFQLAARVADLGFVFCFKIGREEGGWRQKGEKRAVVAGDRQRVCNVKRRRLGSAYGD